MLKIENLSKAYGSQILFENVTVSVNRGERVGLVGRNGHGKTTLLRLIMDKETPDSGSISTPKGYRIGYLRQHLRFTGPTILEEAAAGLPEEQTWRAEKVLAGLGFSVEDMGRPPRAFSGGYQVRLNLARLLVSDSDLLLLDEPTNYLDVVAIRWLEKFFLSWKGELILVTHDRSFMDTVTTHTMGIHRQRVRKIEGETGKYYSQIAQEEEVHERSRINIERKRRQTEEFIRKFRAKARLVGLVQSRIRTLEKQKVPQRLEAIRTLDFSFRHAPFKSKVLMETGGLAFRWPDGGADLFRELRLTIGNGDRLAVVGSNGKGKTTLLRVLAGELEYTTGELKVNDRTRIGFFGQTNVDRLERARTVVEELTAADPDRSLQKARAVAGTMMFEGDAALKKIEVLSGGEKSRVLLGRLLLEPHNVLILDEPTNHLDMDTAEALLEALEAFEGAVIIVTHNEMFLHRLAERLVVFDRDRVTVFDGSYAQFLGEVGWESEDDPGDQFNVQSEKRSEGESKKETKRESRKERARQVQERTKETAPLKQKICLLEKSINEREKEIDRINRELVKASGEGNADRIGALSKELKELNTDIEKRYQELFENTEKLENLEEKWSK
jgi:ATP-binding cassette subfamily F protein 3